MWRLNWSEQVERGLVPVTLRLGSGRIPPSAGATVQDWPLNVYSDDDAVGMTTGSSRCANSPGRRAAGGRARRSVE